MFASLEDGLITGLPATPSGFVMLIPAVLVSVRAATVVLVSLTIIPVPAPFKLPDAPDAEIVTLFVPYANEMLEPAMSCWLFGRVDDSLFFVMNVWLNVANTEPASVVPPVELVKIK